jgi:hypothetical protein
LLKDDEYMDDKDKYLKFKEGDDYILEDGMKLYLNFGVKFDISIK